MKLINLLLEADLVASTKSQYRRLAVQGALTVNGEQVGMADLNRDIGPDDVVKVGKAVVELPEDRWSLSILTSFKGSQSSCRE